MKRFPKNYLVAAGARWGAWLIVLGLLLNSGTFAQAGYDALPLVFFAYITFYGLLWTQQLPRLLTRVSDGSVIILYDLLLSMLPVAFSREWSILFLPFALSVLVVPTVSRGWRGGALVAATFLAIDQIILWTMPLWTNALTPLQLAAQSRGQNLALLSRTILPFAVVTITAASVELLQWFRLRRPRPTRPSIAAMRRDYPIVRSMRDDNDVVPPTYRRNSDDQPEALRAWGKDRANQSALTQRSAVTIRAALEHLQPELAAANVALTVEIDGDERRIAPQVHDLLTRALEIALDNVISHARARTATLLLQLRQEHATLLVTDDGIGLFDGTAEPPGFHQIKRLRYRVEELGGALDVTEREEGGVAFKLRVPLKEC